jgi:hypothetical protein
LAIVPPVVDALVARGAGLAVPNPYTITAQPKSAGGHAARSGGRWAQVQG